MYRPSYVANSFLYQAWQEKRTDMDQLKVQKLVYYLNGWFLAIRDTPLVGESFEAWRYGPVLASLYHQFKTAGRDSIRDYAADPDTEGNKAFRVGAKHLHFYEIFDQVWDKHKHYSGFQLSHSTHAEGTPWSEAIKAGQLYLSDDSIRQYFINMARPRST